MFCTSGRENLKSSGSDVTLRCLQVAILKAKQEEADRAASAAAVAKLMAAEAQATQAAALMEHLRAMVALCDTKPSYSRLNRKTRMQVAIFPSLTASIA